MATLYDKDELYTGFSSGNSSVLDEPSSAPDNPGIGMADATGAMDQGMFIPMNGPQPAPVPQARPQREPRGPDWFGWRAKAEARQQRKQHADAESLRAIVSAMEHGVSMRQGMGEEEQANFDEMYGNQLEKIQPGSKQTFLALSKRPDLMAQFKSYEQYMPEPLRVLMKTDPKKFMAYIGTAEGQKAMTGAKDHFDLRLASKKVQLTKQGITEFVPKEKLQGIMADGIVTATDIMDIQQYLPKQLQLSEIEQQAIQRNKGMFFEGLGILHGTAEQGVFAERAKRTDKNAPPPTQEVDGKKYSWDPDNKLPGARLGTDKRYALLGAKDSAAPDKEAINREFKLRDDYRQDTKKFVDRKASFESVTDYVAKRAENKTSAGDQALAYAYAKSRDPNDRLAVSETKDLKSLGNIFQRFQASIESLVDKGQVLPDAVAKEMYAEVRRSFREQNKAQKAVEDEYRETAKRFGASDKFVRQHSIEMPDDEEKKPKEKEQRKRIGNVDYVKRNGQWYEDRP